MNGDNPIKLSASENHSISFRVYNPSEYISVECLNQILNLFHKCSRYNLFVERSSVYLLCGKIQSNVSGHTINLTIAANDFKPIGVLIMLMKTPYGEVNCTFNFKTDGQYYLMLKSDS